LNGSQESMAHGVGPQTRWLIYLIYLQAAFLALTYAQGVWTALNVHDFSITLPEVIGHGLASSGFALLTGIVGFLALLGGHRRVAYANIFLFVVTVFAGSTGFAFLANTTDPNQIALTNLSMIATIAIGMPITGYSLVKESNSRGSESDDTSAATIMTYLALGALSATTIAGAAMLSTSPSWYAFAVSAHVGLAALLVALVLGVLLTSVIRASDGASLSEPQTIAYSLVALGAAAVSGADGVVYLTSGSISYVVVMAEVGILVYVFLIITSAAAHRRASPKAQAEPAKRVVVSR